MLKAVCSFVLLQSLSKYSKSLKCGEVNHKKLPQGVAKDVQGTLQREIMSYSDIAGYVSPQLRGNQKKQSRCLT